MSTPTRAWHPFRRTREQDLAILAGGGETGWWDEDGRPAPWPDNFLHPTLGWIPYTATITADNEPKNPPF